MANGIDSVREEPTAEDRMRESEEELASDSVEKTQAVPLPGNERTQLISPIDSDRTQAIPAPESPTPALSPQEQDRRLAQELRRRGLPPDEIERLISLGRTDEPSPRGRPTPVKAIVEPSLIPFDETFVPKPTIQLPEFRESSAQDRIEAERRLTSANIARRRGLYKQAEQECRAAVDLTPKDGPALELYGDILQGLGRVDDAAYAYKRALEADVRRQGAEKKFAEIALAQSRSLDMLREEFIPRNPTVAIVLSALFPGAGQVYNGDWLKGVIVAVIFALSVYYLGWTDMGFSGSHKSISPTLAGFTAFAAADYIYGVVDANISARRGRRPKSGWDV